MAAEGNGYFETDSGRVSVAPEIVERVVVDELRSSDNFRLGGSRGEGGFFSRRGTGIRMEFVEGRVAVTLPVHVRFSTKIRREARELQGKLVRAIAAGTGLEVERITIEVHQVFEGDEPEPSAPSHDVKPPEPVTLQPVEA